MRLTWKQLAGVTASSCVLVACGTSALELGPQGWRVPEAKYTIDAVDGTRVMPDGWRISNYEKTPSGAFEKQSGDDQRDLELRRAVDDGIAVVATEPLPASDAEKNDQALAERFVRVVSGSLDSGDQNVTDGQKKIAEDFAAAAQSKDIVAKVRVVGGFSRGGVGVARGTVSTPQQ